MLSQFDIQPEGFSLQRVQDELVGQMAELLEADYDTLSLEIDDSESRQRALTSDPSPVSPAKPATPVAPVPAPPQGPFAPTTDGHATIASTLLELTQRDEPHDGQCDERLQGHIVSPAPTTERLQSIQRLVADQLGDKLPDFETDALRAIPVQVGGLYPISDVWYIEPGLDVPDRLRVHIAQFAREIAEEAAVAEHIDPSDVGIGFICMTSTVDQAKTYPAFARAVLTLLHAFSAAPAPATEFDRARPADDLAPLLRGSGGTAMRLSDAGLVKLFRLLRLARRLLDLESGAASADPDHDC